MEFVPLHIDAFLLAACAGPGPPESPLDLLSVDIDLFMAGLGDPIWKAFLGLLGLPFFLFGILSGILSWLVSSSRRVAYRGSSGIT